MFYLNVSGDLLGIPYLPPYASPDLNDSRLIYGVNYASAAGGILDESGRYLVSSLLLLSLSD